MSDFATNQFIEQARKSLVGGRSAEALDFAEQAVALDPRNAEGFMLMAIALSQLNRLLEAEDAFAKSAQLSPENPKLFYNWAVHRYSIGEKQQAIQAGRKALDLDPSHASARDLVIRLESELGLRSSRPPAETSPPAVSMAPPPTHYYTGYEPPLHSLKFVEKMGPTWDRLGWGCAGLRVLMLLFTIAQMGSTLSDVSGNPVNVLDRMAENPLAYQTGSSPIVDTLALLFSVGVLLWLILDILDRRASWLWLVPYFLFCCMTCSLLDWIIVPLYAWVGRPKLKS